MEELSWFEGAWTGTVAGDEVEEIWLPGVGGQRPGIFRWLKEGKPWLYEWMLMAEFDGQIQIRFKHFDTNAMGWEEKGEWAEFVLVETRPYYAAFRQAHKPEGPLLVYERRGDRMSAWFEREGEATKDIFTYRLAQI